MKCTVNSYCYNEFSEVQTSELLHVDLKNSNTKLMLVNAVTCNLEAFSH